MSQNVFYVVSALQFTVFSFLVVWLIRSLRSYVGGVYRTRSLAVSLFSLVKV